MVDIMNWRKSSYSGDNSGNCVEVAGSGNRVLVRDTNDRNGAMLRLTPDAWRRFADRVKRSLASDLPPTANREAASHLTRLSPFAIPSVRTLAKLAETAHRTG